MPLEDDVRKAIQINLPAQVGDLLMARLQQAEKDAAELATTKKGLDVAKNEWSVASAACDKLEQQVKTEQELSRRAEEQNSLDRKLQVREAILKEREGLLVRLDERAEKRVEDLKQIVGMVFANNVIKKRVTEKVPVYAETDQHGHMNYPSVARCADKEGPTKEETTEG